MSIYASPNRREHAERLVTARAEEAALAGLRGEVPPPRMSRAARRRLERTRRRNGRVTEQVADILGVPERTAEVTREVREAVVAAVIRRSGPKLCPHAGRATGRGERTWALLGTGRVFCEPCMFGDLSAIGEQEVADPLCDICLAEPDDRQFETALIPLCSVLAHGNVCTPCSQHLRGLAAGGAA